MKARFVPPVTSPMNTFHGAIGKIVHWTAERCTLRVPLDGHHDRKPSHAHISTVWDHVEVIP